LEIQQHWIGYIANIWKFIGTILYSGRHAFGDYYATGLENGSESLILTLNPTLVRRTSRSSRRHKNL